jgi:glycerophosphoryl diester phosphodiesterase
LSLVVGWLVLLLLTIMTVPAPAQTWVVAHRGGVRLGPENALVTFEKARRLGVDAVELDIHQSRDGALVVIHDSDLERTHAQPGKVNEMTREQLLRAGVPTLEQALDVLEGMRLLVEIKHPQGSRHEGIELRLLQLLRTRRLIQSTVVISFDRSSLKLLHEMEPDLATGFLTSRVVDPAKCRSEMGVSYLCPHYSKLDANYAESIREAGLKIGVWTVNEPEAMRQMVSLGCDAITTDDPRSLMDLLGR